MDKLPRVYQNKIDHDINCGQDSFYSQNSFSSNHRSIKVNDIFTGIDFIYKKRVEITLNNNMILVKDIVSKNDKYLITIDNEKILINDIKDIKVK